MSWTKKQTSKKAVLSLDGPFLAPDVEAARQDFITALAATDRVEVEVSNTTDIDTVGVQLLLAARQSAPLSNKSFCLTGNTAVIAAAAVQLGLQPSELI